MIAPEPVATDRDAPLSSPALRVEDLSVSYRVRRRGGDVRLRAVDRVDLAVLPGQTVSLVGESGSGKSTTARAIMRLVEPDSGRVVLDGTDITQLRGRALRRERRKFQMVFQDPYSSLNPLQEIGRSIAEPLRVHEDLTAAEQHRVVAELLGRVGLDPSHASRRPHEFSGGQRQRVAIARALAVRPKVLVCDEAVSALDVSTQIQVVALLQQLQAESGIAYLFIAHDLGIVRHISDRVAVMYLGRIVEEGPVGDVFADPIHPYTQALLSAVPVAHPARQRGRERIVLGGEPPDPTDPPGGCPFHVRCPVAFERCATEMPATTVQHGDGFTRCHLAINLHIRNR